MSKKKIIILIIIAFSLCMSITLLVLKDRSKSKLDVVAVNDIVQSIVGQWEELDSDRLPGLKYGLEYVVMDQSNHVVAATRNGLNTNINAAVSNRDIIVDIIRDDILLGKLIIYNDTNILWQQYRKQQLTAITIILVLTALLCLTYLFYIDKIIMRPFRKLQSFAKHVAEGRLDTPLEMDKSNIFGAFTESFDLMREALDRARENERIANQSKRELVASLSHDIKTPIASIKAVSEIMSARTEEESEKSQLSIINSKADQINSLITNMFSATLEELQELRVEVSEQPSLILYELIRNADYQKQVTVTEIAECIILTDELRLAQVIDNVISNSYKYAKTKIDVSTRIVGNHLEISFQDYGQGVTEDEKPLLFNKFYRAKNAEQKSGTGLGLYISKYLINKMSGEIDCENTVDGFVVKIKLSLA